MEVQRITDVELLVKSRLDFMERLSPGHGEEAVIENLRTYFREHLTKDDFVALAVKEGGEIVSTGVMLIRESPPSSTIPHGKSGLLLNILTYPEHQGKGYGKALINAFIEEGRLRDLSVLDLHATEQGFILYEKMGFKTTPYQPMRLIL